MPFRFALFCEPNVSGTGVGHGLLLTVSVYEPRSTVADDEVTMNSYGFDVVT